MSSLDQLLIGAIAALATAVGVLFRVLMVSRDKREQALQAERDHRERIVADERERITALLERVLPIFEQVRNDYQAVSSALEIGRQYHERFEAMLQDATRRRPSE